MKISRRRFLVDVGIGAGAATAASLLPIGRTSAAAPISTTNSLPDAGGFLRLSDWAVCIPPQEWANSGDWVIDGVMEKLKPKSWHSWGIWPAGNVAGRVPAIFSDEYFSREATRQYLTDHPGREWATFNEPEIAGGKKMMPSLSPDKAAVPDYMSPELAVDVTLEFIDLAKSVGNEFQWMAPNITLNTSHNGLGWLTEYMSIMRRKKGIMRPCSWGIHPYGCNTVTALRQAMTKWWAWWETWGSGAPTRITEVCAEGEGVAGQILVMNECYRMLRDDEVDAVCWASAYKGTSDGTNWQHYALSVLNHETQTISLTPLGEHWKELQHGL